MIKYFLSLMLFVCSANAQTMPLYFNSTQLQNLGKDDVFFVKGVVKSQDPLTLVVRIDDYKSGNYASRVNIEKRVTSGEFIFELPLSGLKTTNHRNINLEGLKHLYFFAHQKNDVVSVSEFGFKKALVIPNNAVALSFGLETSPIFQGFERVLNTDPRILSKAIGVLRHGVDPLLSSGMRGLSNLQIPFPKGKAVLTLYTEDVGAWETLPPVLHQRIRVNGETISETKLTPQQWIEQRYLKNGAHEAHLPLSLWKDYGERRGGRIVYNLDVGDNGVTLELAGEGAQSTFLSALILEKDVPEASQFVEKMRETWFNQQWRIANSQGDFSEPLKEISLTMARNSSERVEFSLTSEQPIMKPLLNISQNPFQIMSWAGQRRLVRRGASDNLFDYKTEFWRADISSLPLTNQPRPYLLWIHAPASIPAGTHSFTVANHKITIKVLETVLDEPQKPAGFYHDEAPHLLQFASTHKQRHEQLKCDLAFMAKLGINGVAPSLATDELTHLQDFELLKAFKPPFLAYTPAKRLHRELGAIKASEAIKTLDEKTKGALYWSIADEPSNPDLLAHDLTGFIKTLRETSPKIKLAAQLNTPKDIGFVPHIDVALINDGYGVDEQEQNQITKMGKELWFYNLSNARLAAGFWLHHSKAKAYLQWHSRMPTADPFDPTDGREGDVFALLPQAIPCPQQPDVTSQIFEMAEGLNDQKYLQKSKLALPKTSWNEAKKLNLPQIIERIKFNMTQP